MTPKEEIERVLRELFGDNIKFIEAEPTKSKNCAATSSVG
jgi:hypothetical protein